MQKHFETLCLNYEASLSIKQLGFNEWCFAYYYTDKTTPSPTVRNSMYWDFSVCKESTNVLSKSASKMIFAPTYLQAILYLGKKYNVWIVLDRECYNYEVISNDRTMFSYLELKDAMTAAILCVKGSIENL